MAKKEKGKPGQQPRELTFINYLIDDLSKSVGEVYDSFFTDSGRLRKLGSEQTLNALFDLHNKTKQYIEQINDESQ